MSQPQESIGVGVIGLGFMGATHVLAWQAAAEAGYSCRLVAVCDRKSSRRAGDLSDVGGNFDLRRDAGRAFDPAVVRGHEMPEALLADPRVDVVSICTRTDTHVALVEAALRAGKHVLVEKPVALDASDVRRLIDVCRRSGRRCVPAMCVRSWPGWAWLRHHIRAGTYGRCLSLTCHRLTAAPAWSEYFADASRSGGALFDLHIHNVDFIRWCFGTPARVTSAGRPGAGGGVDHITTLYHYPDGPGHVVAEGGWDHAPGFAWRAGFVAIFEHATAELVSGRDAPLRLYREGVAETIATDGPSGFDGQVRLMLDALTTGEGPPLPTLEDALAVTEMLHAEDRSVRLGAPVAL